jgi:hypothetical protein
VVAITSSDTGHGVDGPGVGPSPTTYGSGAYGGFFPYGSSSYIGVRLTDAGAGVDGAGSIGMPITHLSSSDAGSGSDSASVSSTSGSLFPISSDAGHGAETTASQTSTPYPSDSDFGTGVEGGPRVIYTAHPASSDSGHGADSQQVIAGISLVQSNSVNSGAATVGSQVITLPAGISAGNLVVVCVGDGNSTAVPAVTGPSGWSEATDNCPVGPVETSIWYVVVTPAMAGQTSWTFTPSAPMAMSVSISEHNSIYGWLPFPLDQVAQGNVKPATAVSTTIDSGTTPLTSQPGELWVSSLVYGGQAAYTENTPWTPITQSLGSLVSLAELFLVAGEVGSADSNISIGTQPFSWAGCAATFMAAAPFIVSDVDFGTGAEGLGGTATVLAADAGTGVDASVYAAPASVLSVSSSDAGTGWDGGPDVYGTGLYGAGFYSPQAYIPVMYLQTVSDYAVGQDNVRGLYGAPGPALSAAAMRNIFEGFSLSRAAILGTTGAENGQLYGAQSITLTPNVTATAMQEDDWDAGVWYSMNKAALTVTNGFMSWATLATLTGIPVSSFGSSPNDYYGLPLWTQQQHNQAAVPMAFRMSARNASASVRTLDFLLYRVQLAVADFTGMVYKQGLGVSYAGTVLFSSVDERGNNLPFPQIGRFISSPGTRQGAFAQSAYA